LTCGNAQNHPLTGDDATHGRSVIRVVSQKNASHSRPGLESASTREKPDANQIADEQRLGHTMTRKDERHRTGIRAPRNDHGTGYRLFRALSTLSWSFGVNAASSFRTSIPPTSAP
jgi:hypothetical protein